MKRKKHFYSWFGDDEHLFQTPIYSHSEALKQASSGLLFFGQLQQQKGKRITLVTSQEHLAGIVEQVYSDHLVFRVSERVFYVPVKSILYFYV